MDGGKEKRRGALGGRDRRKGVDSSMGDWEHFSGPQHCLVQAHI